MKNNEALSPRPVFLNRLDAQIEQHLSDPSLDLTKLLRSVGMSRTDLHRKLDRTTGMSATEYVRKKRLEKAVELLHEQPEWNIYQVALEVGFENHSYFTRRFREEFGRSPREWQEQETGEEEFC